MGIELAIIVALALGVPSRGRAPVRVEASGEIQKELAARMQAHGVTLEDGPSSVRITPTSTGFAIEAVDVAGRKISRSVSSLEALATWIESWACTDLSSDLLRPARVSRVPIRVPLRPLPSAPARVAETSGSTVGQHLQLGAHAESMIGSDGGAWFGGAITASFPLSRVRMLFDVRLASSAFADDGIYNSSQRLALEGLVKIALRLAIGPLDLSPSVGAGLAWMKLTRTGDLETIEPLTATRIGPRFELGLHAGLPISARASPDLAVAFSYAPLAHSSRFYPPYTADPGTEAKIESLGIAGEPAWYFRVGLGLKIDLLSSRESE